MNHQFAIERRNLWLGLVFALAAAPGCTEAVPGDGDDSEEVGVTAQASSVQGFGWAWVLPDGSVGAPYFRNSTGGTVVGFKLGTGQYGVEFQDITSGGSAHVVAYGGNAHCKLSRTPHVTGATHPTKVIAYVTCHSAAGSFADSAFAVFFDARWGTAPSPYRGAYFNTTGGTSPTVIPGTSWSSAGGTNAVSWSPTSKQYTATLPGMTFSNAAVHVTALGGNAYRCKVGSWGTGVVSVRCYDPAGAQVPSGFSLSYLERSLLPGRIGGHAWISGGAVGSGYAAAVGTVSCFPGGTFSVAPSGLDLNVSLTDSNWGGDHGSWIVPMISAYGSSSSYCSVMNWSSSTGTGTSTVRVRCFNASGTQVNAASTAFTSSITHWSYPGPC